MTLVLKNGDCVENPLRPIAVTRTYSKSFGRRDGARSLRWRGRMFDCCTPTIDINELRFAECRAQANLSFDTRQT